jgi:hypothetical protein
MRGEELPLPVWRYDTQHITSLRIEWWKLIYLNGRERESAINRALDGRTYPSKKLVPSSLRKKYFILKHQNLD